MTEALFTNTGLLWRPRLNCGMTKTYHRVAFVDLTCFTGGLATVVAAHGRISYCQAYAHTELQKALRCSGTVAGVGQTVSFKRSAEAVLMQHE